MTSIAYTGDAERERELALERTPATPREDAAATYIARGISHPMGAVRLVTPAEWDALERRARTARGARPDGGR
jgi:hypothetical protein